MEDTINVAIIIGVAEYQNSKNNLPGCLNDAKHILNIINLTKKYHRVFQSYGEVQSQTLKDNISVFFEQLKDSRVNEVFFYYTGHGELIDDEFFYLLTNYDPKRRNQTALQNSYIDNLLRSLSPELTVKVIDACNSGKGYIKSVDSLEKYFKATESSFKNCIFLNSSLTDQYSWQEDTISDFTRSFIYSVKNSSAKDVRYRHIIDYILDDFDGKDEQTPFFVLQASLTEKFCELNEELRKYLDELSFEVSIELVKGGSAKPTLKEIIESKAKGFISREKAFEILEQLKQEILNYSLKDDLLELADIYTVEVTQLNDNKEINKRSVIGAWLNKNRHVFFAEPETETREKQEIITSGGLSTGLLPGRSIGDLLGPKKYETVIVGYKNTQPLPYLGFSIDLNSKYPNELSYNFKIVFLLSREQIGAFYFLCPYEQIGWEDRQIKWSSIEWIIDTVDFSKAETIPAEIIKILDKSMVKVLNELKKLHNIEEPEPDGEEKKEQG